MEAFTTFCGKVTTILNNECKIFYKPEGQWLFIFRYGFLQFFEQCEQLIFTYAGPAQKYIMSLSYPLCWCIQNKIDMTTYSNINIIICMENSVISLITTIHMTLYATYIFLGN